MARQTRNNADLGGLIAVDSVPFNEPDNEEFTSFAKDNESLCGPSREI